MRESGGKHKKERKSKRKGKNTERNRGETNHTWALCPAPSSYAGEHTHSALILPPHLRLTSPVPPQLPTNPFNTAAVVAAARHAAAGSTGTAGPHGDQGRRETLHFPGQDDRARAAALRVATLAVAAGGNLTPEAGAAAGARSWRTGRADPCPTESAREEDAAAAGWASAAEG